MRRISVLLVMGLTIAGCAHFGGPRQSLRALIEQRGQMEPRLTTYEKGKRYLQLGNYGLAIEAFQNELATNPESTLALNGLALSYERLGRHDAAQHYLDLALAVDPNSTVTLNNLSYFNLLQGKSAVAVEYAARARAATSVSAIRLPADIEDAVSRNSQLAAELARSQAQELAAKQTLNMLDMNSGIQQTGEDEWKLSVSRLNFVEIVHAPTPLLVKKDDLNWTARLPPAANVRISNGTGRHLMANRFAGYLSSHGLAVHQITNAAAFDYRESAIFYNPDEQEYALSLAGLLPFAIKLIEARKGSGQIEFVLGNDLLDFDEGLAQG